ncbi:MAG: hypothetical protein A2W90_17230 [Bacteroidetes bacterium GWF2_42_66]|nr:MAG: hypothetical protein A2W92_07980 [Bacteroidetes bacterium GWA2_42_15]OFX96099.1 MAG: hypothetical protein A2W89_00185 [Bacteroidetes bacterium GWE2_42_39]OFY44187.1 MAG: hypothetical protein A2W90_17230 [Bacteroidetes bacterium GWF2_42_66]HBL75674.1 hypothetical protein [Prolixibacteraceae bacterium]HCR92204.1 hypothetical protein [Prolixibacteraceae bacterium]
MKKSKKLITAVAIFFALVIGFLIGISVEYPRLNNNEVSGTIGKVNNYRNTKATEADIQLKDELLADSVMLKSVKNYLNFFYVRSLEYGKNIDFAVSEANASEAFKSKNGQQITALDNYGKFLGTARKDLLAAVAACESANDADPAFLRDAIAQANNIVAQMNYRNSAVLNFITRLDAFIQENGIDKNPGLNKAHDLLVYNEVGSSLVLKDKVLLKFFEKKKLYSKDLTTAPVNIAENIQKDMEQLKLKDTEQLNFLDTEKLGAIIAFDAEKLGSFFNDAEKLGTGFTDSEKLGVVIWDVEKLGAVWDSEKLGSW